MHTRFCCSLLPFGVLCIVMVCLVLLWVPSNSCDLFSHIFQGSFIDTGSYNCPSASEITLKDMDKMDCYQITTKHEPNHVHNSWNVFNAKNASMSLYITNTQGLYSQQMMSVHSNSLISSITYLSMHKFFIIISKMWCTFYICNIHLSKENWRVSEWKSVFSHKRPEFGCYWWNNPVYYLTTELFATCKTFI